MSSTTSSPNGFLSSPRMQQRLLWISGAVLAIGVVVFLGVYLSRGTSQPATGNLSTIASPPPQTKHVTKNPKAAPSGAAFTVARTFLETAVQRKNLDAAYGLVGPNLKGGMSRAQWHKGNIAVTYYPAANVKTAKFVVKSSHKNDLLLQVALTPRKGSGVRPLGFKLGLQRAAGKRWIVNYWVPDPTYKVQANPYSN